MLVANDPSLFSGCRSHRKDLHVVVQGFVSLDLLIRQGNKVLLTKPSDEESADRWFKCKLIFITLDEKSGAEKKTSTQVLVQAADLRDAVKKLDEGMKGTMADYQIGMVSETPLMDVYPYSAEPNDKPEFDPSKA